ncbi:MAG: glutathione S-transferase family protein [Rhodovibrionaceae bacterium]|nr:glutathione S-transferase family protein [Rhodovibrionaceae bacterium]
MSKLTLVSHHLCPYVQRAAIALAEKAVPFERNYVDLSNKPDWFRRLSPLGKVPVLRVRTGGREAVIFESAVILEYLEETQPRPLHPDDPLERARHRSWIEFGSSVLNRIAAFYSARSEAALAAEACALSEMLGKVEAELGEGPWFAGAEFSLVDTAYGPIFRYFDVFEEIGEFVSFDSFPKLSAWRSELARRPSVQQAVSPDYPERLLVFLKNRESALGARVRAEYAMSS